MSESSRQPRPGVVVAYVGVEGFSGQVEASRTLVGRLPERGWEVHELVLPAPRSRGLRGLLGFALASVRSWFGTAGLFLRDHHDVLALNVLLSRTGFLRMRPILALWRRLSGGPVILSLHGSNFLTWDESDPRSRELVRLVGQADTTTVLSPRQRDVLVERGVDPRGYGSFRIRCPPAPRRPGGRHAIRRELPCPTGVGRRRPRRRPGRFVCSI